MRVLLLLGLFACVLVACKSTGDSDRTQESLQEELKTIMNTTPVPIPPTDDAPVDSLATDTVPQS